ncbi:MAG: hypothetical protein ACLGH7_12990, partial [Actinomycetes bacterium]
GVWDIYDPTYDPIRRHHLDDPHGGPFANARDRVRLNLRRGGSSPASSASALPSKASPPSSKARSHA